MSQGIYSSEENDRGWYRVAHENDKLKREIERLKVENKLLHNALKVLRNHTKLHKVLPEWLANYCKEMLKETK